MFLHGFARLNWKQKVNIEKRIDTNGVVAHSFVAILWLNENSIIIKSECQWRKKN